MAKIKQKLSKALKMLSIKKVTYQSQQLFVEEKPAVPPVHKPKIFCGSRSTHGLARNARTAAC